MQSQPLNVKMNGSHLTESIPTLSVFLGRCRTHDSQVDGNIVIITNAVVHSRKFTSISNQSANAPIFNPQSPTRSDSHFLILKFQQDKKAKKETKARSTAMASIFLFLSLHTSLLFSWSMAMTSANHNATSYIRTSCSRTLYPGLCYSSLSPYAGRVGCDPVLLARFAMNVTLARLKPLSVRIASLRHHIAAGPSSSGDGPTAVLKDCSEMLSDATDLVAKSEKEVTGLEGMVGPEVTWRIGNAQTWLSASITDESTCTDEFKDGSGGTGEDVELEVRQKVKKVKQLTSNALALVNSLVNSYR